MISPQLLPQRLRRRPQLIGDAAEGRWLKTMRCSSQLSAASAIAARARWVTDSVPVHKRHLAPAFSSPSERQNLARWPRPLSPMALQLLLAAPIYTGFVTSWDAFDLPAYSYVWNTPESTSSGDGLGQAITYAVASTFCEDMLPHFSERSYILPFLVNCQLLRAALARAFATWADNHPYIKFLDISDRCDAAEVWKCRGEVDTKSCGCGVEVLIDVASNDPKPADRSASSNERAAYVRQRTRLGPVRTPAGEVHQALASVEADLFFNNELCWYPPPRCAFMPLPTVVPRATLECLWCAAGTSTRLSAHGFTRLPIRKSMPSLCAPRGPRE